MNFVQRHALGTATLRRVAVTRPARAHLLAGYGRVAGLSRLSRTSSSIVGRLRAARRFSAGRRALVDRKRFARSSTTRPKN
jgi:hypothetical protein